MGYIERQKIYKSIVSIRKKPLIAYVTSIRPNLSGHMAGDAISPIIEQINKIPKSYKEVDFLIISNGGDPITSLRIIGLLRERFEKITVLLPYVAYSAATILALGATYYASIFQFGTCRPSTDRIKTKWSRTTRKFAI